MSTHENTATEKPDVYSKVTDAIVTAIEQGVGNWRMPWHTSGKFAFSPINVASHKPYRGVNTLCLWAAAQRQGYELGEWGTYAQWQERGAQVRKGEKATTVVFWKFANSATDSQEGEEQTGSGSRLLFTRGYAVFNAAQVDGYAPKADGQAPIEERIESAEVFFSGINARVAHQGNRAYYSPSDDSITLPPFAAFVTPVDYYSTRAHESAHWTSRADRCNRELGKRFGDAAYSVEELVAELAAAFTLAQLGLSSEPRPDHAQYIGSWLKVLKADKRAIFTAASKAQQAADYLIQASGRSAEVAA
ncbi:MAG: zincin-like metallopeptidase domain-containing protein [Candidatus Solibacter sp.]